MWEREEAKENDVSYKVKLMEEGERGHCNTMHMHSSFLKKHVRICSVLILCLRTRTVLQYTK